MQLKLTQLWLFMPIQVALQGDKILALEKLWIQWDFREVYNREEHTWWKVNQKTCAKH